MITKKIENGLFPVHLQIIETKENLDLIIPFKQEDTDGNFHIVTSKSPLECS